MSLYQWFIFFLAVQLIHGLGTWKLYEKAGRARWAAFVPVYNSITLMKIINRPTWWTVLLFIPIINLIMFPVIWVETLRSFGKNSTADTWLGIFTFGFYIYLINYTQDVKYIADRSLVATTKTGDTVSSLLFAIVVATLVHTYVMQPFTIPTSSLEKSLLIGDFLFVSKFHYGARTPMTTVAAPMVHDTLPIVKTKSYLSWPQLPYFRFPGFQKIEKNDIVVFNWPADTVYKFFDTSGRSIVKPIDKKSNYVKRCQGTPGDSLQIKNGVVFINGKELILPERAKPQHIHKVYAKGGVNTDLIRNAGSTEYDRTFEVQFSSKEQADAIGSYIKRAQEINKGTGTYQVKTQATGIPLKLIQDFAINIQEVYDYEVDADLTDAAAEKLRKNATIDSVVKIVLPIDPANQGMFPQNNHWSLDNFGPIYIPEAGKTVSLNLQSLPFYKKIIKEYEKHDLKVVGNDIYIDNKKATTYTFGQNYYWMMGDNRHNSEDSRYWGYVPEDHIVGKPVFIWMSWDSNGKGLNKIRWERLFTTVSGEGQPQSYFKYFLGLLILYFVGDYFWKKKKANNS
ncbi:signal peptidase I [Flavobacterium sp. XGLA_31]|uniref:signal peptidase I n=1 Tax=Flavobacterium sp. XGLA_31 TaxID=3447666 RepID=UPI003F3CEF7B